MIFNRFLRVKNISRRKGGSNGGGFYAVRNYKVPFMVLIFLGIFAPPCLPSRVKMSQNDFLSFVECKNNYFSQKGGRTREVLVPF